ncbi:MAG TPA: 4-hydroxy-tetrahydrodipicolinate reductase [Bacteroidales bacterium]|nr:4-hydroxy-tetrahydrodipicolinate reductase [Bacteroidales bacterium]
MAHLRIALIGYGRMGHEIEAVARERGHQVVLIIDRENQGDLTPEQLKKADVAIEFTLPDAAYNNIMSCLQADVPVVSGTTGWLDRFQEVVDYCREHKQAFFHASNFSIGVNLFFRINQQMARIMNQFTDYDVEIEETHHVHKVDAPSGTAVKLADILVHEIDRKKGWKKEKAESAREIPVRSIREDEIPGIHRAMYHSSFDDIEIKHSAKSREGFALGAVLAAEFVQGRQGIYSMEDLLNM